MKFIYVDKFSVATTAPYADVFERVKLAIGEKKWRIKSDSMGTGSIEGEGRILLNTFSIKVTFRTLPDQSIQVDFMCGINNVVVDIGNYGEKKCAELIDAVVKGAWVTPIKPPPAATPIAPPPVTAPPKPLIVTSSTNELPNSATRYAGSSATCSTAAQDQVLTTGTQLNPKKLLILASVCILLIFYIFYANSDAAECKKEAYDNFIAANRLGGQAEYVKMCVKLRKQVREIESSRRRP